MEIWQTIFQRSLPYPDLNAVLKTGQFHEAFHNSPSSFAHFRTVLCLVSRSWKDCIYGTPTLWSTIIIYDRVAPSTELVKRWCRLSASCSLDVYADPFAPKPSLLQLLEWWDMPTPRYHQNFPDLIALFATNLARIGRLILSNWEHFQTPLSMLFPSNTRVQAPRLEVLLILQYDKKGGNEGLEFVDAPCLHTLYIRPTFWTLNARCYPHLRFLSISTEGLQPALLQDLSMFLHLEYLAIHPGTPLLTWSLESWLQDPGVLVKVTLPAVKHIFISVQANFIETMLPVLTHMDLPKLESLTYSNTSSQRNQETSDCVSALLELPCFRRIRYLTLEGVHLEEEAGKFPWSVLLSLQAIYFTESYIDGSFHYVI